MSTPAVALRLRHQARPEEPGQAQERRARRMVILAWCLLFLNALTFYPGISFLPIPSIVGKGGAQAALLPAMLAAIIANRRGFVRPNVFLCLVCLLVVEALVTTTDPQHLGTIYRTVRLGGFAAALWLLTPWWGRRDLLLVRAHLTALSIALISVLAGLVAAPSHALAGGRLGGAIWPIPATQVAHYSAVAIGLVSVLWMGGRIRGRIAGTVVLALAVMLILTHTRTALFAMLAGILVAGLSLFVSRARVRRLFAIAAACVTVVTATLSAFLTHWLDRGESSQELGALTGRTTVWHAIVSVPRDKFQVLFGFGLSNKSFDGLPIDSNWLASYYDQGLFGVAICAAMLLFLFVNACFQPRSVRRALALFLVTYCTLASVTEVGFTDASTYLLELTLAASLLAPPAGAGRPE